MKKDEVYHHYILYEYDNTGYVIDHIQGACQCEEANQKMDRFFEFFDIFDNEDFANQKILDKWGSIQTYSIETHKATISEDSPGNVWISSSALGSSVVGIYHLTSYKPITNFKKLNRYHPSRYVVHPRVFFESEGEYKRVEVYLS